MKNKKVLLVEDKIDIQDILSEFLREKCCSVDTCFNGNQAMRRIEKKKYDLIVTDLIMPERDGFSFIRSAREKTEIPIVVITGGSQSLDFQGGIEGIEDKVLDILRKPFTRQQFWDAVNTALSAV